MTVEDIRTESPKNDCLARRIASFPTPDSIHKLLFSSITVSADLSMLGSSNDDVLKRSLEQEGSLLSDTVELAVGSIISLSSSVAINVSRSMGPQPARKELVVYAEGAGPPLCTGTGSGLANFTAGLGCSAAGNELAKGAIRPLCTGSGNVLANFTAGLGCSAAGNELAKGAIPPLCTGAGNVLANFTAGLGCSGIQKELAEGACPPLGIVT